MINYLLCVSNEEAATSLAEKIFAGEKENTIKLYIVAVQSYETYFIRKKEFNYDMLNEVAKKYNGEAYLLRSNDIAKSLMTYLVEKDIKKLVIEETRELNYLKTLPKMIEKDNLKITCEFIQQ